MKILRRIAQKDQDDNKYHPEIDLYQVLSGGIFYARPSTPATRRAPWRWTVLFVRFIGASLIKQKPTMRVILYKWSAPKYFKFLLAKAIFKIQICQIWQVVYSLNSSFVHFDGMKMKLLHDRVDHIIAFFHRNSWQATLLTGLFKHEMEFRRLCSM